MPCYEFAEGASNKFWDIELSGSDLTTKWGKVGTAGQSKTKSFATPAAAKKEHDKLVAEKTGKGYQLAGGAPSAASTASAASAAKQKATQPEPESSPFAALVDEFRALAEDVTAAGFEVEQHFGPPATEQAIAKAEKARGKPFPTALRQLLAAADGFKLIAHVADDVGDDDNRIQHNVWSTKDHVRGGDYKDFLWFDGDAADAPRRNFVIVDMPQDEFCFGYVIGATAPADPKITYHYCGEDMEATRFTLKKYLEDTLQKDRKALAEALERRASEDEDDEPIVDPSAPRERLKATFEHIDFQRESAGVVGYSNVSFHEKPGPGEDLRALVGVEFAGLNIERVPADVDLAPLAAMRALRKLTLVFDPTRKPNELPAALTRLEAGCFTTIEELEITLPFLDSLAFLRAFKNLKVARLEVTRGSLPADLRDANGLTTLAIDGQVSTSDRPQTQTFAVPAQLTLPETLQELELKGIGLSQMPKLTNGARLTSLVYSNNQIARIENLDAMRALEHLSLQRNLLTRIEGLEAATSLRQLFLGNNNLTTSEGLGHLEKLVQLSINANALTEVPALPFPALRQLDLAKNKLKTLPTLGTCAALETLEVYENKIQDGEWIASLPKKCWVRLKSNALKPAVKAALKSKYADGPKIDL